MPEMPKNLVPAKYIGNHAVELGQGMRYYNIDGSRRKNRTLEYGDTLMIRDEDVYGKTLLHDPQGNKPSLSLGIGHKILPEHAGLSRQELGLLGYEFHAGRPDFTPLEVPSQIDPVKEEIPTSAVIDDSQANIEEFETVPLTEDAQDAESEHV